MNAVVGEMGGRAEGHEACSGMGMGLQRLHHTRMCERRVMRGRSSKNGSDSTQQVSMHGSMCGKGDFEGFFKSLFWLRDGKKGRARSFVNFCHVFKRFFEVF